MRRQLLDDWSESGQEQNGFQGPAESNYCELESAGITAQVQAYELLELGVWLAVPRRAKKQGEGEDGDASKLEKAVFQISVQEVARHEQLDHGRYEQAAESDSSQQDSAEPAAAKAREDVEGFLLVRDATPGETKFNEEQRFDAGVPKRWAEQSQG